MIKSLILLIFVLEEDIHESSISRATLYFQFDLDYQNEVDSITTADIVVALCLIVTCLPEIVLTVSHTFAYTAVLNFLKVAKLKKETQLLH